MYMYLSRSTNKIPNFIFLKKKSKKAQESKKKKKGKKLFTKSQKVIAVGVIGRGGGALSSGSFFKKKLYSRKKREKKLAAGGICGQSCCFFLLMQRGKQNLSYVCTGIWEKFGYFTPLKEKSCKLGQPPLKNEYTPYTINDVRYFLFLFLKFNYSHSLSLWRPIRGLLLLYSSISSNVHCGPFAAPATQQRPPFLSV